MKEPLFSIPARPAAHPAAARCKTSLAPADLARPAVVFAPHQDDETLGCGGTIIKKKRAGADVLIVFMSDGRYSHAHLMPAEKLRVVRQREALDAARTLGVPEEDVLFLDYEETRLSDVVEEASSRVAEILSLFQPEEVFVPYRRDVHRDHLATHQIVSRGLERSAVDAFVHEYPVWAWFHWPRVRLPIGATRNTLRILKNTVLSGFGYYPRHDLGYAVYVGDVIDQKRAALEAHASQMTRLVPDTAWSVLGDVADGDFLSCFMQDYEVFHRYHTQR